VALLSLAPAAWAVLDINDRGPVLNAGSFALRITNIGVVGNAFYDRGLSFDPSFEFPRGSGHECLHHAELWVGAKPDHGPPRVSGGPMLEWRPSIDPNDRVRTAWAGQPGTRPAFDDDGDGRLDEELLDGIDEDGDGEIDEDLAVPSQQILTAGYRDDRPEAVNYIYPSGERHVPLGLAVHQEAYATPIAGYDQIAGLKFTITNVSAAILHDVYLGLYCDLDSRGRDQNAGHLNDLPVMRDCSRSRFEGESNFDPFIKQCFSHTGGIYPTVQDGATVSGLPAAAVVPMTHTTDPLGFLRNFAYPGARAARDLARAPRRDTTFRFSLFDRSLPPGQGGPPILDGERDLALRGDLRTAGHSGPGDWCVLVSCGPFVRLSPGETVEFQVALVAASVDSLAAEMAKASELFRGARLNLQPDTDIHSTLDGRTGVSGYEICYEPPPGIVFNYDAACPEKWTQDPAYQPLQGFPPPGGPELTYSHGRPCIWTDFDCDACTGLDGTDFVVHWVPPGIAPPPPAYHASRGDHQVEIAWDNLPEILLGAGIAVTEGFQFAGYRLYRLSDWAREAVLPPPSRWQLLAAYGPDTTNRQIPLASIRDTSIVRDYYLYEQPHYPIGRYRVTDTQALNGFDYNYVVTSVAERRTTLNGNVRVERLESPLVTAIDSVVVPQLTARDRAGPVWVVPNPYRANAPWDRPPVPADPFGRHIDFLGLPRARATIRIYTVAGDFVAQVEHDGSTGDGQASWNLISRNGQDTESGIYLFTVDSPGGHQVGRFVVIR
jgi:hypothetical protein